MYSYVGYIPRQQTQTIDPEKLLRFLEENLEIGNTNEVIKHYENNTYSIKQISSTANLK